jgi:tRNA (guanine10-N2)-dimethyltransferase
VYVLELGGQDDAYAVAEASNAATDVSVVAPGLALAASISPARIQGLAYTHRASTVIGVVDPELDQLRQLVNTTEIDRSGPLAVRARNVRGEASMSTKHIERELGSILTEQGFGIDLDNPVNELRVLVSTDVCVVGWFITASIRDYGSRIPTKRPFFQPGTLHPLEARSTVNLAHARPDRVIFDPMCGTGGFLIEAGLLGASTIGMDAQRKMINGTKRNLTHYLSNAGHLCQGDVTQIPLCTEVDAIVVDVPYGRQSKITGESTNELVARLLEASHHITERMIVVSDASIETSAHDHDWDVLHCFPRPVHQSLTRYVHVLVTQ